MSDSLWPMDRGPPGSSICGILQARTLEWVAMYTYLIIWYNLEVFQWEGFVKLWLNLEIEPYFVFHLNEVILNEDYILLNHITVVSNTLQVNHVNTERCQFGRSNIWNLGKHLLLF